MKSYKITVTERQMKWIEVEKARRGISVSELLRSVLDDYLDNLVKTPEQPVALREIIERWTKLPRPVAPTVVMYAAAPGEVVLYAAPGCEQTWTECTSTDGSGITTSVVSDGSK